MRDSMDCTDTDKSTDSAADRRTKVVQRTDNGFGHKFVWQL